MKKKEARLPKEGLSVEKDILEDAGSIEPAFLKEIDTGRHFSDVPLEFRFWLSDGRVIKNLNELAKALRTMGHQTFNYHANREKNDFSTWVRDIVGDASLAEKMKNIRNRDEMAATIEAKNLEIRQKKKQKEQKELAEKMEIEKAIQKVKERESSLEKAVAKEKIIMKPVEAVIPPKKEAEITALKKDYSKSETLRKLSNLREMVGLPPLMKKEERTSKVLIKSPKIKESPEAKSIRERERQIGEKEQWIMQEERRINEKRIKLSKMRIELIRQRNELEKEKFEQFMKRKGKMEEKIISESRIEIKEPESGPLLTDTTGIEELMSEAKSLLMKGEGEEARKKIKHIKSSLSGMLIHKEEKKRIEYSLMELEADAKLAML